jgi:membrane protease YdiL (CAAX protease family)
MALESTAYAAVFGVLVGWLTALVLTGPRGLAIGGVAALDLPTQLVISLGAGLYEELAFRVLLVGALLRVFTALLPAGRSVGTVLAVVLSALIFSAFHYIGSLGDTFTVPSFTFRAIAGVAFSVLYVTRGFGIAAWTHALYDLGLSVLQAGN